MGVNIAELQKALDEAMERSYGGYGGAIPAQQPLPPIMGSPGGPVAGGAPPGTFDNPGAPGGGNPMGGPNMGRPIGPAPTVPAQQPLPEIMGSPGGPVAGDYDVTFGPGFGTLSRSQPMLQGPQRSPFQQMRQRFGGGFGGRNMGRPMNPFADVQMSTPPPPTFYGSPGGSSLPPIMGSPGGPVAGGLPDFGNNPMGGPSMGRPMNPPVSQDLLTAISSYPPPGVPQQPMTPQQPQMPQGNPMLQQAQMSQGLPPNISTGFGFPTPGMQQPQMGQQQPQPQPQPPKQGGQMQAGGPSGGGAPTLF